MKSKIVNLTKLAGLALAVVNLAACGSTPAPVIQQVDVPVAVSCVKSEDVPAKPAYEFDKLTTVATDGAKVLALANDWPRGRKYEDELAAIVEGCRR